MSMGYGGWCRLAEETERMALYRYGAYDLNVDGRENKVHILDGEILIWKDSLVKAKIRLKCRRLPNGRKLLEEKRILTKVSYEDLLQSGKVEIQNCSNCTIKTVGGQDAIAVYLLRKIFENYQKTDVLPEREKCHM